MGARRPGVRAATPVVLVMEIICQICGLWEPARPKGPGVFLTGTGPTGTAKYGQQKPSMVWLLLRHPLKLALKIMRMNPAAEVGQVPVEPGQTDKSRRNEYVRQTV